MEEHNQPEEDLNNQSQENLKTKTTGAIEGDPTKIHLKKNPGEILMSIIGFVKDRLSLRKEVIKYNDVVENTRAGVTFKGYNVWILMCSIVVASVGLNVNSTAVIIGAMLISPLMGPIRGIGFGVAMNDFPLLIDSLKNLGVTVGISVLTSFLYFFFTPIHEVTSELLGRTEPTFLDVVIAFFGGLAGIIAATKGKNDTVIPGVAIATALMPPLCTVGYGLAIANWQFALGAFYLFLLNSLLIALSTFVIMKYLRFPIKEYVNPKVEKKVRIYIIIFLVIIISPSAYLFYKMSKRSIFETNAKQFFTEVVVKEDPLMKVEPIYTFDMRNPKIELFVQNRIVSDTQIEHWKDQLKYFNLENCSMDVVQGEDFKSYFENEIQNLENNNTGINDEMWLALQQKEDEIQGLNNRIKNYETMANQLTHGLDMNYLLKGYKIDYPEISEISIDRSYSINEKEKIDTSYVLFTKFKPNVSHSVIGDIQKKLSNKFLFELQSKKLSKQDTVYVYAIP